MQPKLFLMLAVVVLLAALVGGNPFLSKAPHAANLAVPLIATPPASPAAEGLLPGGLGANVPAASQALNVLGPANLVSSPSKGKGTALAPTCPDPQLRPLVIGVETDGSGRPIWVLQDGRRLWRNPVAGRQPLLVPAPSASGKTHGR